MPEQETIRRAKRDLKEGKSPSTAAGKFVHEEIEHVREGKHGARSPQQVVAIGLSEARRAGIPLPPPKRDRTKEGTRKSAEHDYEGGQAEKQYAPSASASGARQAVLEREPRTTASHSALSKQSREASHRRTHAERQEAAEKAVKSKGKSGLRSAALKAAKTHAAHRAT